VKASTQAISQLNNFPLSGARFGNPRLLFLFLSWSLHWPVTFFFGRKSSPPKKIICRWSKNFFFFPPDAGSSLFRRSSPKPSLRSPPLFPLFLPPRCCFSPPPLSKAGGGESSEGSVSFLGITLPSSFFSESRFAVLPLVKDLHDASFFSFFFCLLLASFPGSPSDSSKGLLIFFLFR